MKLVYVVWWRPKRLAEYFAKQGIRGPPYRFFLGNLKEGMDLIKASSYPMPVTLSHYILPRVLSFGGHWKTIYDRKLIREIFFKSEFYEIVKAHPVLMKQFEDENLVKHHFYFQSWPKKHLTEYFLYQRVKKKRKVRKFIKVI